MQGEGSVGRLECGRGRGNSGMQGGIGNMANGKWEGLWGRKGRFWRRGRLVAERKLGGKAWMGNWGKMDGRGGELGEQEKGADVEDDDWRVGKLEEKREWGRCEGGEALM